jgi:hypothetical protein
MMTVNACKTQNTADLFIDSFNLRHNSAFDFATGQRSPFSFVHGATALHSLRPEPKLVQAPAAVSPELEPEWASAVRVAVSVVRAAFAMAWGRVL